MTKVVLVWNEHPTEVVAGFHARKVARILRERYGHEVIVEKIPFEKTNLGIARKATVTEWDLWVMGVTSHKVSSIIAEKHGAPAFNFHCSRAKGMGCAETKQPEEFEVKEISEQELNPFGHSNQQTEIIISPSAHKENGLVIELPAHYIESRKRLTKEIPSKLAETAQRKVREWLIHRRGQYPLTPEESRALEITDKFLGKPAYYSTLTAIRHPEQQKYLHPAISEKIAAAIHERITRRK